MKIKVLAVDDRDENLLALRAALEQPELEILTASSGREALVQVNEHDFAAILLDVQMPEMDGFETARNIRQNERSRSTPIIFVTAIYRTDDYAQKGYDAGAVDYLFKPLNVDILRAKVAVFVELFRKNRELERQAELLRQSSLREQENKLLREALRSRDEFLSIASHELKTPITPLSLQIQSFLQLAEEGQLHQIPEEKLRRMLRTSRSQVERLSRLINDLLDVSRIVEGRLTIEPEETDLCALVRSVVEGFAHELKSCGSLVNLDLPDKFIGHWDRFRIEQVLINLLTNAMKYGRSEPIDVRVFPRNGQVTISVRDRGIGIEPKDQHRIFNRFERAVSSRNYGGLGLGLYISNQIVQLHGGAIEVESTPGHGSDFRVTLPSIAYVR